MYEDFKLYHMVNLKYSRLENLDLNYFICPLFLNKNTRFILSRALLFEYLK